MWKHFMSLILWWQKAMLLPCEEWCNSFGNVMTTTMTRLFKCNFNFKTSIGHHLSSFCHQSLIGPERDKGHIISDSVVIVKKYNRASAQVVFMHAAPNHHYPECFDQCQVHIFKVGSYLYFSSFLLFLTFLDHKYVFRDISNFQFVNLGRSTIFLQAISSDTLVMKSTFVSTM